MTTHNEVLPKTGQCPGCDTRIIWGEVIRGCYARRERSEAEQEDRHKAQEKAVRKARRKKGNVVDENPSQAVSELSLESPTKRWRSTNEVHSGKNGED